MQIENLWVSCLRCTRCDCQHVTEFPAQPKTACRVAACTPQGFQSHGTIPSRLTPRNPGFVTPRERSPPGPPTRHQRHRLIRRSCSGRARSPPTHGHHQRPAVQPGAAAMIPPPLHHPSASESEVSCWLLQIRREAAIIAARRVI